jgi:glycosyltransferase involved in cell wall biosynthesis
LLSQFLNEFNDPAGTVPSRGSKENIVAGTNIQKTAKAMPRTIGVLICTYRRAESLQRCLKALELQTRLPDRVTVVVRDTDSDTRELLTSRPHAKVPVRVLLVKVPGLIAARNTGLNASDTDILAITDDDACPHPDWLVRIFEHFISDPQLGGLGGRDRCHNGICFNNDQKMVVAKIQWFGRMIGNHHLGFGPPQFVDMLKGTNMSYRAESISSIRFDDRLHGSGSQAYEDFTFSLAVRRAGWRLRYDPAVLVDHYEETREEVRHYSGAKPVVDRRGFQAFVYNGVVARWEELSSIRHCVFVLWSFMVGVRVCPGIVQAIRFTPVMGMRASWYRFWLTQTAMLDAYLALSKKRTVSYASAGASVNICDDFNNKEIPGTPPPARHQSRICNVWARIVRQVWFQ